MALYYTENNQYHLVAKTEELFRRTSRTNNVSYWPMIVLYALCDHELDMSPVYDWTFSKEIWPAVLRILSNKNCLLEEATKEACYARIKQIAGNKKLPLNNEALMKAHVEKVKVEREAHYQSLPSNISPQ